MRYSPLDSARVRRWGRRAARQLSRVSEAVGVHVVPRRFYSSEPDRRWLRSHPDLWQRPLALAGVDWDLDRQIGWLRDMTAVHLDEVAGFERYRTLTDQQFGPGYGPIESQVLHCVIRQSAPARVIEIGAGISTALVVEASERNTADGRTATHVTTIDPYPTAHVEALGVELITEPAQQVSASVFSDLGPGDLLFIDSTHAVKTGSELARLYIDIIPALPSGVRVHIHDLYLPYPYMPTVLDQLWDWQETVLVAALLTGNAGLLVDCSLSALHVERPAELEAVLPDYRPAPTHKGLVSELGLHAHFPSSLWLEVAAQ